MYDEAPLRSLAESAVRVGSFKEKCNTANTSLFYLRAIWPVVG